MRCKMKRSCELVGVQVIEPKKFVIVVPNLIVHLCWSSFEDRNLGAELQIDKRLALMGDVSEEL